MIKNALSLGCLLVSAAAPAGTSPVTLTYSEPLRLVAPDSIRRQSATVDSRNLRFDAFGQRFDIELKPNRSLQNQRSVDNSGFVAWEGKIAGLEESWARISYVDGQPQGLVFDGTDMYAVEDHQGQGPVVFRLADLKFAAGALKCPTHGTAHNAQQLVEDLATEGRPPVLRAAGATRQIDIGVLVDSQFLDLAGQDAEARILARMNTVDGIYSDQVELQINVGSLDIFDDTNDPFSQVSDAGDLLDEVNDFRTNSAAQQASGLTHLFTGRDLAGSTAGIAFLGVECRGRFGVGLTQATFGAVTDGLIAAHELGHNFGAEHDGEEGSACESEPENFLMAPSISGSREFSNCTLQVVRAAVDSAVCVSSLVLSEIGLSAQPAPLTAQADIDAVVGFSALNEGTQALSNAAISATIPAGVQVIGTTSNIGNCTASAGSVDCSVATLNPEQALDIEITVRASTGGDRTFSAVATSSDDTNLNNNEAEVSVQFDAATDLVIVGGTATTTRNQAVALPIQVNVESDDGADDVVVSITPDAALDIQSADWTGVGSCIIQDGVATCSASTLNPSAQTIIDLQVVSDTTGTLALNINGTTSTIDVNSNNNLGSATVTVDSAAPAPTPPNNGGGVSGGGGGGGAVFWLVGLFGGLLLRRRMLLER